jgi:ribosomal protein S18 acetylase RimI-like enzyme
MTQAHSQHRDQPAARGENHGFIRPARKEDLRDIVAVHESAFANSFLMQLGCEFLQRYYAVVLSYRGGILLVKEGAARVEGFASGFIDPEGFYRLMSQRKARFALPILFALIRRPWLAARIVDGVQRVERPRSRAGSCELSSLAVRPELGGRGTGRALVSAFAERAWSLGARHVVLHTDADDNEAANAFYRRVNFQLGQRFQRRTGRWMNEYVIDLPLGGDA